MTLPGEIGDHRPGRPGGGNWGGNWGGGNGNWNNGNWAGGNWGNGNWGSGNWGNGNWNGNNWGNNYYNNWSNTNNNFNYYGPGWSGARWGNWYQGSWGTGLGAAWGAGLAGYWAGSLYNPGYYYNSWGYLPSAWNMPIYGAWGLNSLAYGWTNTGYVNPYITPATQTIVVQQPIAVADGAAQPGVEQVVAYDYSQPIDTGSVPDDRDNAELAQQIFESARSAFKSGNYGRALSLTDQALSSLPNDPVLHEFRGLVLFALKRYEEAAAAEYAVLSAGPGWNWTTLVGLYDSVDDYTKQLRTLEAYAAKQPQDAAAQFLIGYHYLVQNFPEESAKAFANVAKLRPEDKLSANFAKALVAPAPAEKPSPASSEVDTAGTEANARKEPPPPPPQNLLGTWTAHPDEKVTITLTLSQQGTFSWAVAQDGRTQTIEGQAGFQDNVLVLGQSNGPPLAGKITLSERGKGFTFRPTGAPDDVPGLSFTPQAK